MQNTCPCFHTKNDFSPPSSHACTHTHTHTHKHTHTSTYTHHETWILFHSSCFSPLKAPNTKILCTSCTHHTHLFQHVTSHSTHTRTHTMHHITCTTPYNPNQLTHTPATSSHNPFYISFISHHTTNVPHQSLFQFPLCSSSSISWQLDSSEARMV